MIKPRVIPCLLLCDAGLVKTRQFKSPSYLGDPINIIRIFNDLEVDEIILLDIGASKDARPAADGLLKDIASECFMPLCFGGGIRNLEQMRALFNLGIEKISTNTGAVEDPDLISLAADQFGSQSVVVSVDVKRSRQGDFEVVTRGGRNRTELNVMEWCLEAERRGAGELLINSVDRDGMMDGYDIELVRSITSQVGIPVISCGGAGAIQDLVNVIQIGGASAAAAGSFFVYQGKNRSVLINYPKEEDLKVLFGIERELT